MVLSLGQRIHFFTGLGQLYEAGFPLLKALETLLEAHPSGAVRPVLEKLRASASGGANLTESLASPGLPFSQMEISLLRACEISGQLPQGCTWLATYFTRLQQTRQAIWKKTLYPLFLLHLGILLQALPKIFQGAGSFSPFQDIILPLGGFYAVVAVTWIGLRSLLALAENSRPLDAVLRRIPVFGGIRRSLALMRFCNTYVMQLDAGVNVMDCLLSAGAASHSATLRTAVDQIIPGIRLGHQVGSEMAATRVFPADLVRAMVLGEQTGKLDQEVGRVANEADARASAGIEALGNWIPKLFYFAIVGILAWKMITAYRNSMSGLDKLME